MKLSVLMKPMVIKVLLVFNINLNIISANLNKALSGSDKVNLENHLTSIFLFIIVLVPSTPFLFISSVKLSHPCSPMNKTFPPMIMPIFHQHKLKIQFLMKMTKVNLNNSFQEENHWQTLHLKPISTLSFSLVSIPEKNL